MEISKIRSLLILILFGFLLISCGDSSTNPEETGTIYVESEPPGAEIWIDSVHTGVLTPGSTETPAGSHLLTLKKKGYKKLEFTLLISAGEEYSITSGAVLTKLGQLIIESEPPGATIWLDGRKSENLTPASFYVEDDNYTITLQLQGYRDSTVITQVSNAGTMTLSIDLQQKP